MNKNSKLITKHMYAKIIRNLIILEFLIMHASAFLGFFILNSAELVKFQNKNKGLSNIPAT